MRRGYAFIVQNERGRYFSEGKYQLLGYPQTDGYDALSWIAKQPWSNGKVGTLGCSSSAEWQLALAARMKASMSLSSPGTRFITPAAMLRTWSCLWSWFDEYEDQAAPPIRIRSSKCSITVPCAVGSVASSDRATDRA